MAARAKYLMIASMDVDPEHEATFNEVYDTEHVPYLREVTGVGRVTRYKREELTINIGGEARNISRLPTSRCTWRPSRWTALRS